MILKKVMREKKINKSNANEIQIEIEIQKKN